MLSPEAGRWLGVSALIIAFDQLSKFLVTAAFQLGESRMVTSFFDLVFVFNRGAAFSFLAQESGWQRWFLSALALGISGWLVYMLQQHAKQRWYACALALVLGGALGNLIDRLIYGAVVDFLSFHLAGYYWPAFNVADSAICIGVALMLWQQFQFDQKTQ